MTKEQAEAKAAKLTAAGTPTAVRQRAVGFRTVTVATKRRGNVRYSRTQKGYEATARRNRRHDAEGVASGRTRERNAARIASGAAAQANREARARKQAYDVALFAESPEKRVVVQDAGLTVVLSDLQIPFEDVGAVNQALGVIAKVKPRTVILNGDVADCYDTSSFLKDSDKAMASIPEMHVRTRLLLDALKDVPTKIWMGGNHEDRWRRLLWSDAPTTRALLRAHQQAAGREIDLVDPTASFAKLFNMDAYGFTYYPYSHRLYLAEGNLVVTHGKYASRHSGHAAKRTWEWIGRSCIVGHTHRLGSYLITQDGRTAGAWENGCLCQLEPEYDDAPNWQQGFSIVNVDGPEFHVVQVPIVRRAGQPVAVYGGI